MTGWQTKIVLGEHCSNRDKSGDVMQHAGSASGPESLCMLASRLGDTSRPLLQRIAKVMAGRPRGMHITLAHDSDFCDG